MATMYRVFKKTQKQKRTNPVWTVEKIKIIDQDDKHAILRIGHILSKINKNRIKHEGFFYSLVEAQEFYKDYYANLISANENKKTYYENNLSQILNAITVELDNGV